MVIGKYSLCFLQRHFRERFFYFSSLWCSMLSIVYFLELSSFFTLYNLFLSGYSCFNSSIFFFFSCLPHHIIIFALSCITLLNNSCSIIWFSSSLHGCCSIVSLLLSSAYVGHHEIADFFLFQPHTGRDWFPFPKVCFYNLLWGYLF